MLLFLWLLIIISHYILCFTIVYVVSHRVLHLFKSCTCVSILLLLSSSSVLSSESEIWKFLQLANLSLQSDHLSSSEALNQFWILLCLNRTSFTQFTHIADCFIIFHRSGAVAPQLGEMCFCILTDDFPRSYESHFRWWDQWQTLKLILSNTRCHPPTEETSRLSPCRRFLWAYG